MNTFGANSLLSATVTTEDEAVPDFRTMDVFYPTKDWQEVKPGRNTLGCARCVLMKENVFYCMYMYVF